MYAQDIGDKDVDNELFLIARVYKIGMIFTPFGFKFFSRQLLPACFKVTASESSLEFLNDFSSLIFSP